MGSVLKCCRDSCKMGKKDNSKANEKAANVVEDPLALLPKPFSVFNKNGLDLTLETVRAPELPEETKAWAFDLVKTTMKPLYDAAYGDDPDMEAEFGWKEKDKREELWSDHAWYLIARTEEGKAVAFSHFRYDMDYDDEVVYCYEIQVEKGYRRKGLGKFMMKVLEFFKKALKFELDETSFVDTVNEQFEYEILCRFNQIKRKKMEEEEGGEKASASHHGHSHNTAGC